MPPNSGPLSRGRRRLAVVLLALAAALTTALSGVAAGAPGPAASHPSGVADYHGLSPAQQAVLRTIASDTWRFYAADVDPVTHLPLDNLTYAGGSAAPTAYGRYTSASNVGVYLWAIVAAHDLGLISGADATTMANATLAELTMLRRYKGFLYQWYDTSTGDTIRNPGDVDCAAEPTPRFDNCYFISNVDNGWYASGLIVARQALPGTRTLADQLLAPMDFGLFYDDRAETHCNVNPAVPGNQPTGQMYGGYYVGLPPSDPANAGAYYHNGALYSDPRISAYIGMGRHQMPGNVWWRSWRELPPPAPFADCQATDPDFSWQGQWPMAGAWRTYTDPVSGHRFPVWEGHYQYPGSDLSYIPTWAGGMFEALMADQIVPETSWGRQSFGRADEQTVKVQMRYATQALHYPVWGMSPSSTADDTGGYAGYGVEGLLLPAHQQLSQCVGCASEDVVTPHASFLALDVAPQQAYANIAALRRLYPGVYGPGGYFDAVNPTTGAVGHRYLVLDQSMILAALDNALANRSLQRHFAAAPESWAARTYLSMENMFVSVR